MSLINLKLDLALRIFLRELQSKCNKCSNFRADGSLTLQQLEKIESSLLIFYKTLEKLINLNFLKLFLFIIIIIKIIIKKDFHNKGSSSRDVIIFKSDGCQNFHISDTELEISKNTIKTLSKKFWFNNQRSTTTQINLILQWYSHEEQNDINKFSHFSESFVRYMCLFYQH